MEGFIENIIYIGSKDKKLLKRKQKVVGSGPDILIVGGNTDFYYKKSFVSDNDNNLSSNMTPDEIVKYLEGKYKLKTDFIEAKKKLNKAVIKSNTRNKKSPNFEIWDPKFNLLETDVQLPKLPAIPKLEHKHKESINIEKDFYEYMQAVEEYYIKMTEITYTMLTNIKQIMRHN